MAAATNLKLYAFGAGGTTLEYDPATDIWTSKAAMNPERLLFGVAASPNGKVYVAGGSVNGGPETNLLQEYDPATDTWTNRSPMPTARSGPTMAAGLDGKLYAVGGTANNTQSFQLA